MKINKTFLATTIITALLTGCASTRNDIIPENYRVIEYESRCMTQALSNENNLVNSSNEKLLSTMAPKYPLQAAQNGIEGYTKLEFDISSEGKPVNITVVEAYPSDVFNAAAIEALSGWRYHPTASGCNSIQLDFKLG